jgi:hypothetical protein
MVPHLEAKRTARPVDAGVQVAAATVLGKEGIQLGQQAHRRGE